MATNEDDDDDDGVDIFCWCVEVLIVNGLVTERCNNESNKWKDDFLFEFSFDVELSEVDNVRVDDVVKLGDFGDVDKRCVGDKDSGDLPERSDIDFLIWFLVDVRNVGENNDGDESCLEKQNIIN